jgi:iron complex transport system ATP-binding protein
MSQVIDLQNVSVVRSSNAILDAVTFSANSNERWVILGANGAGKTTMLRV